MLSSMPRQIAVRKLLMHRNPNTLQSLSRSISAVPRKSKVYELRKYSLKPHGVQPFVKVFKENFHLRLKYSQDLGFWLTELGALNQLISLWPYDDFNHRTSVRRSLAEDKEWMENFVAVGFKYLEKQENSVVHLPEWCSINMRDKYTGVYELVSYGMKMGGPVVWEEKLKRSLLSHARLEYADLVGAWYTDIGDHNRVEVLWRFDSMDARKKGREKAHNDAFVVNTVRDNLHNVQEHSSVILTPLFSG